MTIDPTTKRVAYQSAIRSPNARVNTGRRSRSGTEDIADAAHGVQQLLLEWTIHLVAQPAHEHVDDVRLRVEVVRPHMRQDHGLGDDAPGTPQQIFRRRELARPQAKRAPCAAPPG